MGERALHDGNPMAPKALASGGKVYCYTKAAA